MFNGSSSLEANCPLKSKANAGLSSVPGTIGVEGMTTGVVCPEEIECVELIELLPLLYPGVLCDLEVGKLIL